jgi:lipid-binding SYLF domain-containing protein
MGPVTEETVMERNTRLGGRVLALSAALLVGVGVGCSSSAPKHEGEAKTLASDTTAALSAFKNEDSSLEPLLDKSVGYAVFPEVGKAGFIAGGSYGKGEVFEGGNKVGYADITQATFGLQAGAQTFSELVVFMRPQDLAEFKGKEFKLAGNISAVAIKAGAAGTADTSKGVIVFVRTKGGLMAEASIGGQRFRFTPLAGAPATTAAPAEAAPTTQP